MKPQTLLFALVLNAMTGMAAGGLLAWPFVVDGGIVGTAYGSVAGICVGCWATIRRWPIMSICTVCTFEFFGAMCLGVCVRVIKRELPFHAAIEGQIIGGAIGIVLAEVVRYRGLRTRAETNGPPCPQCGYSLQGNASGTCPECGRPVKKKDSDA